MNTTVIQIRSRRQTGIALIAAMMILMILTLLGITVMNMSSLEEKMAFNTQDRALARYLAESSIMLQVTKDNLPPPDEPGVSSLSYPLTDAEVPGLESGEVRIVYTENPPSVNLPKFNPKYTRPSTGSGEDNPWVFQVYVRADTAADTTAELRSVYSFTPLNQN